jgi:hypothetical protein
MIVLPFNRRAERSTFNTAACLKSINAIADAVLIYDNQRFGRKDGNLNNNYVKMNREMVDPFFDLLCAGEETKSKFIGSKTLDTGDIIQTLTGWTYGFWKSGCMILIFLLANQFCISSQTSKGFCYEALLKISLEFNTENAARVFWFQSC